jgi:hypothetical protein
VSLSNWPGTARCAPWNLERQNVGRASAAKRPREAMAPPSCETASFQAGIEPCRSDLRLTVGRGPCQAWEGLRRTRRCRDHGLPLGRRALAGLRAPKQSLQGWFSSTHRLGPSRRSMATLWTARRPQPSPTLAPATSSALVLSRPCTLHSVTELNRWLFVSRYVLFRPCECAAIERSAVGPPNASPCPRPRAPGLRSGAPRSV